MKAFFTSVLMLLISFTMSAQTSFYDFKVKTLEGEDFDLASLKGKKVLVVNTASKCGYTPQYEDLEALYEEFGGDDFVVIGFPANNFMKQEPGTNEEIREFCTKNYGVTFPMMAKISVKGDDIHPLYQWLTTKDLNGVMDSKVKWNFQKYLIDDKGTLVDVAYSKEKPMSEKIVDWVEAD
ncbi:MAG: glutathione peroxidase [Bacteroidales bacterium]|nr:glutathione peroxidase [Bacteroidales bacterium]